MRIEKSEVMKRKMKKRTIVQSRFHGLRRCTAGDGTVGRVVKVCDEDGLLHQGHFV